MQLSGPMVYKWKSLKTMKQMLLGWKGIYYTTRISLYTIVWLAGWLYPSNGIRAFLFLRTNAWPYFSIFSTSFVPRPSVIFTTFPQNDYNSDWNPFSLYRIISGFILYMHSTFVKENQRKLFETQSVSTQNMQGGIS